MDLDEFLKAPRESLSIELKSWIDPSTPEGKAKIIKAAIALRNINGGHLIIGVSDCGVPLHEECPVDLEEKFHQDTIQALITKYSSETFEISVEFGKYQGARFPFIVIPPGVRSPVASKSRLQNLDTPPKDLIKEDTVFVRTLNANNTPSSAAATHRDWPRIMDVCFDNREADVGRFMRRHLVGFDLRSLLQELSSLKSPASAPAIIDFLNRCQERFKNIEKAENSKYLGKGYFEVAFFIESTIGPLHNRADDIFLSKFLYANPSHTGWPLWLDTRAFNDPRSRPRTRENGWETLVEDYEGNFIIPHLDFWRAEPAGHFYHVRQLTDDLIAIKNKVPPDKTLYIDIAIQSIAEAISIALSFTKSMGYPAESTNVDFAFRWSGLANREIASHDWRRYISPGRITGDDEVTIQTRVSLDTPQSAIPSKVSEVAGDLISRFGGLTLSNSAIEEISNERLNKRM